MEVIQNIYLPGTGWQTAWPAHIDSAQTLVLVFASPDHGKDPSTLLGLRDLLPRSVMLGCSTAGEIAGTQVHDHSISAAAIRFQHTQLRLARTALASPDDSAAAGERLSKELLHEDLSAIFVLSDGLGVHAERLIAALSDNLPPNVVVTGGLAGDGRDFGHTWVFSGGMPQSGEVCAVGLYGHRLVVGHGCQGGWSDFGPKRRVTRADGNTLHELDGEPALDLYQRYLGKLAQDLPGTGLLFPLSVGSARAQDSYVVRTILGLDAAQKSLTFAGDIPVGSTARLMRANTDRLIESAGRAATSAMTTATATTLVISVSCVGRRIILGQRVDEELECIADQLPSDAVHLGFYSYGEICPVMAGSQSELHNQTMTVTAWSER